MRFISTTVFVLGCLATGFAATLSAALAEDQPYGIGFASVGMSMDDLASSGKIPEGRRIICDSDADSGISNGDLEILRVTDAQAAAGLSRCALFAKDDKGQWVSRRVGLAGQPAEFYILTFKDQGVKRIMQIQLFQVNDALTTTTEQLTKEWGKPVSTNARMSQWSNAVSEATMARKNDGFYLYISDKALQHAMREKLGVH